MATTQGRERTSRKHPMKPVTFIQALNNNNRQQRRASARQLEFEEVSRRYGGEPRRARRGIARTLARKTWKGVAQ